TPIADSGGPYLVSEGGQVELDASGSSDPNQDSATLFYQWDFDGDGVTDAVGMNAAFDASDLDGPGLVSIQLTVSDDAGLSSDPMIAEVQIVNQIPTIAVSPESSFLLRNQIVTISFDDPSAQDAAVLRGEVQWGDGSPLERANGMVTLSHAFTQTGSFEISAAAWDPDGGFAEVARIFEVRPLATGSVEEAARAILESGGDSMTLAAPSSLDLEQVINALNGASFTAPFGFVIELGENVQYHAPTQRTSTSTRPRCRRCLKNGIPNGTLPPARRT
ncbi:MAG: PKD domain-containing protein, partial [Planctomycetales bacterium]